MMHAIIRSESQQYFFDNSFQMFLLDRKVQRLSSHTLRFYSTQVRPFLIWCAETHSIGALGAIKPLHVRAYLLSLHERELSSNSVHAAARGMRAFFNFCVREELLTVSPMAKVTMPKVDRPIPPSFEPGDIEQILKSCSGALARAIVLVLLNTGCRAAELLHMNGSDIDVPQGIVQMRKRGLTQRDTVSTARSNPGTAKRMHAARPSPRFPACMQLIRAPAKLRTSRSTHLPDAALRPCRAWRVKRHDTALADQSTVSVTGL